MLAIYCRISQEKEEGKDRSIDYQRQTGIELAKKLYLPYKIYTDEGISGTWPISQRPAFFELLSDILAKNSKITTVFAFDPSRLYRSDETRLNFLTAVKKRNIELYFNNGIFDWSDPYMEFMGKVLSATDVLHVDITKLKVKGVLKERSKKGKVHGVMPYGYQRDENEKMIPDPEEAEVIKLIYKWSLEDMGYTAISQKLNEMEVPTRYNKYGGTYEVDINRNNYLPKKKVIKDKGKAKWVSGTIKNILHNDTYTGIRRFGDVEFSIPAIIDKATFDNVGKNIEKRRKKSGKKNFHKYLLNDLVFCSKCGKRYTGREVNAHFYYRCTSRITRGASCGNRGIRMVVMDTLIWGRFFKSKELSVLVEKHLKDNSNNEKINQLEVNLGTFERSLDSLSKERGNAVRLAVQGLLKERDIEPELARIDGAILDLKTKSKNVREQLNSYSKADKRLDEIGTDLNRIKTSTSFIDKQKLLRKYIKSITISYKEDWYTLDIEFTITGMPMEKYELDKDYKLAVQVDDSGNRIVIHLKTGEITYHPKTDVYFGEL